jgi:excisionase family DNA binding protein
MKEIAAMSNPKLFHTVSSAARLMGVSGDSIRLWERSGRLPAIRTAGGVRLFAQADLERLARERAARREQRPEGRGEMKGTKKSA